MLYSGHYGKLPIFPIIYTPTEDKIERLVERLYDVGDKILMQGDATQEQYDAWSVQLNRFSEEMYQSIK
jgi:hypothetical protein